MYIVTGGAGMIGSAAVWALNRKGVEDILIVDNLASSEKWKNLVCLRYADYMHRDEFLQKIKADAIKNVQGIVHMGACSSTTEKDADFLMRNNFHYTREVFLSPEGAACIWSMPAAPQPMAAASSAFPLIWKRSKSSDLSICTGIPSTCSIYGVSKTIALTMSPI